MRDFKLEENKQNFNPLNLSTSNLTDFLSQFSQPKEIDFFYEGVKKFIEIALLRPEERQFFYGLPFGGLHFASDLKLLWGGKHFPPLPSSNTSENYIVATDWHYTFNLENGSVLRYAGAEPAQALNRLIEGPVAIDCGMFCQLSMWFGIRYVMGDTQFNKIFGKNPFYVTQYNFEEDPNDGISHYGNPLWQFLSEQKADESSGLFVQYIANVVDYAIKHPLGNSPGQNCIVIEGKYFIFSSSIRRPDGLSKEEVYAALMAAYNQPAEESAITYIASIEHNHKEIGVCFLAFIADAKTHKDEKLLHEYALNRHKLLKNHTFRFDEFLNQIDLEKLNPGRNNYLSSMVFDLNKLKHLLRPQSPSLVFFNAVSDKKTVADKQRKDQPTYGLSSTP